MHVRKRVASWKITFCTLHVQLVDDLGNCFLIARNRIGAENNRITRLDHYLFMHICRHTEISAAIDSPWLPVVISTI